MIATQFGSSFRKFFFRFRSSGTDDISHISISNHSSAFLAFCGPVQFLFHLKPYNGRKEGDATEAASPVVRSQLVAFLGTFATGLDFAPLKFRNNQVVPAIRAEWSTRNSLGHGFSTFKRHSKDLESVQRLTIPKGVPAAAAKRWEMH